MKIEDRLEILERTLQRVHAKIGHEWFRGTQFNYVKPPRFQRMCFCGEVESSTKAEWESLPERDWPDPDSDRY